MQATPNEIPRWIADRTVIYLMPMGCMQLLVNGMIKLGYPGDVHVALVEKTGRRSHNREEIDDGKHVFTHIQKGNKAGIRVARQLNRGCCPLIAVYNFLLLDERIALGSSTTLVIEEDAMVKVIQAHLERISHGKAAGGRIGFFDRASKFIPRLKQGMSTAKNYSDPTSFYTSELDETYEEYL
jgi:hypothetical protein